MAGGGARTPAGQSGRHRPPRGRAQRVRRSSGPLVRRRVAAEGDGGGGRGGSDLRARLLAAIPAIAVALFLVIEGGAIFTFGLTVLQPRPLGGVV